MRRKFIEPDDDLGGPCDVHGQQGLAVCALCGAEFCAMCFPGSELCPHCAAEAEDASLGEDFDGAAEDSWSDEDPLAAADEEDEWNLEEDQPPDEDEDAPRRW